MTYALFVEKCGLQCAQRIRESAVYEFEFESEYLSRSGNLLCPRTRQRHPPLYEHAHHGSCQEDIHAKRAKLGADQMQWDLPQAFG